LEGKVDAWVASIGTGGTFLGIAEAVKKENQDVMTIGVQPEDAPIIELTKSGLLKRIFELFGMKKMKLLTEIILEKGMPEKLVTVSNKDAVDMAYRLCMEEGLFCGMSSDANVYAAIQVAKDLGKDVNVVTVLVDRRDRYFSEHPNEHYII
jgi:cysteine synthase A